jgi:hypothetical protein
MATTLKFVVDPKAPGASQLMDALEKELKALDIGKVSTKKERAPEGTLAIEVATVILVLEIITWSAKAATAIFHLIKEVREKQAADLNHPLETLATIYVSAPDSTATPVAAPASPKKEQDFIEAVGKVK